MIYFAKPVGQIGPVKIGCAANPTARLQCLQTASPVPLEIVALIVGGHDLERALQHRFRDDHLHGEWFASSPELADLIARAKVAPIIARLPGLKGPPATEGFRAKRIAQRVAELAPPSFRTEAKHG